MSEVTLAEGIVSDPDVCGGRPRIAGTRVRVSDILDALAAGDTADELPDSLPYLTRVGIQAALRFAANNFDRRAIVA